MKPSTLSCEVKSLALAICDGYAGPVANKVKSLIASELWDELSVLKVHPSNYSHAEDYFGDAACVSFLRKYEPLPTSIDRKTVAIGKFWEAEKNCYRTNQRLDRFIYEDFDPKDEPIAEFISVVREEVVNLIGHSPPANPAGRFGPGSTYSDKASLATIPDKMQSAPELTREALYFLVPWGGTLWAKASAERGDSISFQRGNRFTTVPKDCTTDRGISIECSINLFYQLAYGKAMREALKKSTSHRLILEQMQDVHRRVAREASITGDFATMDITQASDHQARSYVKLLLPHKWFEPLDDLRSRFTVLTDETGVKKSILLEKFSSMGNGYTFELETVLFLAICCAVMRRNGVTPQPGVNVYVYGDDIIVPTAFASEVSSALRFFGFALNREKTFLDGPFRESCGGDYFKGVDVRPYFLKNEITEPQHFIATANGIRRMGSHDSSAHFRWHRLIRAWFRCLDFIPSDIRRLRGPPEMGDIVIHDDKTNWETRWRGSVRYIRCYRPATYRKVKWSVFDPDVILAGACYGLEWNNGVVIPRDAVLGYKQGWVAFS